MNPDEPKSAPVVSRKSGVVIPHAPTWRQRLAGGIVHLLIRLVSFTLRFRWTDQSGMLEGARPGPAIYCIWHNRLALSMAAYFGYVAKHAGTRGLAAMVSASRDGGFLASILESFGVLPVRGSTSRRGPQALRELATAIRGGYDVAITPDGPRGPRYVVQPGVIDLARLTGRPIVPVMWNASRKISLKSWDRFQLPLPFTRCEMVFEKPIQVPRDAGPGEREKFRLRLEQVLREISRD